MAEKTFHSVYSGYLLVLFLSLTFPGPTRQDILFSQLQGFLSLRTVLLCLAMRAQSVGRQVVIGIFISSNANEIRLLNRYYVIYYLSLGNDALLGPVKRDRQPANI